MRVLGISGSLRRGSYNTGLIRACATILKDVAQFDIAPIDTLPFYNEDVRALGFPGPVLRFREAIRAADVLVIASPEYNRSIPGVLKNAIDWASRPPDQPFEGKPIALMGASRGKIGAAFANYHMRQVLAYLDVAIVGGPEVMVGEAASKFDADGNLIDDASRDFIRQHLARLTRLWGTIRTPPPT